MLQSFLEAVGGRGMGALELVAMDMKARGMYVCRTLSFAGATPPIPPPWGLLLLCALWSLKCSWVMTTPLL